MRIERVPLAELGAHVPPMALAYATSFERLRSRYAVDYRDERAIVESARRAAQRGSDAQALQRVEKRLADLAAPPAAMASLAKLRRGAAAVVTGQQPAVAWGPLYNVYKAVSAVRLARWIDDRGVPCVPLFWNHSDDHHPAELGRVRTPETEVRVELANDDTPLYARSLDADAVRAALPNAPHRDAVAAMLDGGALAEAYSRQMLALMGKHGLVVVEPRDLDGARADAVLRRALAEPTLVERAVSGGGESLTALGFRPPLSGPFGTNVYTVGADGKRVRATSAGGRLSAGVALRLIVQDSVLPTAAYVGGPNECAYIAQLTELYAAYGLIMPAIVPRITATLLEHRVARVAEKFGFTRADLFRTASELEARLAAGANRGLLDGIARVGTTAAESLRALEPQLEKPLAEAARKTSEKMRQALDAFTRRVIDAQRHADETAHAQIAKLVHHVTPGGALQERVFTPAYYLAMYGLPLVDELVEALDPLCFEHQLVWL